MLKKNEELLLKDKDVADTFNEYFGSIFELLDLYKWKGEISNLGLIDSNEDYLDIIMSKYGKHPGIRIFNRILQSLSPRMSSKR